ncbi:MAG TPA: hypothetical protein VKR32_19510 [Puia sp.]|nr:hypothetical protein [Puia sp.]
MKDDENICEIRAETKLRNGNPNWWCYTHHASARGKAGLRLEKCSKADLPKTSESEKIHIDFDDYAGGVGIWGSLEAVFDSKREISEKGVHVHLRKNLGGKKIVDKTFKEVYVKVPSNELFESSEWIMIDEYTACAYTASIVFDMELKIVKCTNCGRDHIDAEYFAVHAHKKHFCTFCGRDFVDNEYGISNPISRIQAIFQQQLKNRKLTKVSRRLVVRQNDYPGGIQIWGSNPAIIWTAQRSEESGIHIHLFASANEPLVIDETFGYVEIDGIELDDEMIRLYMVQKSLPYLRKFIVSLECPNCKREHFDRGEKGLNPHKIHECDHCQYKFRDFTRFKGTVSNPIVGRLNRLTAAYPFVK